MSEINNIANQITKINPEFQNKTNITTNEDSGDFSNAIGKFLKQLIKINFKQKKLLLTLLLANQRTYMKQWRKLRNLN